MVYHKLALFILYLHYTIHVLNLQKITWHLYTTHETLHTHIGRASDDQLLGQASNNSNGTDRYDLL